MIDKLLELARRRRLRQAYRRVFDSPDGEMVLSDMLRRSGVTAPRFTKDPIESAFFEGQRHFVLSVFRFVHTSDKLQEKLAEEAVAQETKIDENQNL